MPYKVLEPSCKGPTTAGYFQTPTPQPIFPTLAQRNTDLFWFVVGFVGLFILPRRWQNRKPRKPVEEWKKEHVTIRDGGQCSYCGKRVNRSTRHIDHSVSRKNGGTNHLNNLRLACSDCNLAKGSLDAHEFAR